MEKHEWVQTQILSWRCELSQRHNLKMLTKKCTEESLTPEEDNSSLLTLETLYLSVIKAGKTSTVKNNSNLQ